MYRAVNNRCAVNFESLQLPVPASTCIEVLQSIGFILIEVDVVAIARSKLGNTNWKRRALAKEAPDVFNCSTFIKWIWAQKGIWLPRYAIQQRECGTQVDRSQLQAGDSIFLAGRHALYVKDPNDGVGHVGIATSQDTVVHAGGPKKGVNEVPLENFLEAGAFRGIRRYLPHNESVYTFEVPSERCVEWSDDYRWIILDSLSRQNKPL